MRYVLLSLAFALTLASSASVDAGLFGPSREEEQAARQEEAIKLQKIAAARAKTQELVNACEVARQRFEEGASQARHYEDGIAILLENEQGRQLTGSKELVDQFRVVYEERRPSETDLAAGARRVSELARELKQSASGDDTVMPAKELQQQVQVETDAAAKGLESYASAQALVEALMRQAVRQKLVGTMTLGEALQTVQDDQRVAALERQRQEDAERQARIEKARRDGLDAEAAAEIARIEAQNRAAKLERDAADPGIQAEFAPFLEPGLYNGGKISNSNFLKEHGLLFQYPKPMSYSELTAADFHNVLLSYKLFEAMACGTNGYESNDRSKWPPPNSLEQTRLYQQRWKRFRLLAPIWRRTGVLSN